MIQENPAGFLWGVADLLRGNLKQSRYDGRVILPFTFVRRLKCVFERTREKVHASSPTRPVENKNWNPHV